MSKIYEQHDLAFKNVSAFVIAKNGERVATIAFKYPKDGASRLWVYVHWHGVPMVRGYASGYGYDKRSAACASASRAIEKLHTTKFLNLCEDQAFIHALGLDDGRGWDDNLRRAGFTVWQAV